MSDKTQWSHFQGKDALQHVIEAQRKAKSAQSEIHGAELSSHAAAMADSAKETVVLVFILWTLFAQYGIASERIHWLLIPFVLTWFIWRFSRSALLGWARLERLHRLIEEEKWEIEHRRPQEKEELYALYAAKGFSGKLLDEVVEVLMADDNRLLQVMLEEELRLSLESFEHPLKTAAGTGAGVLGSAALLIAAGFTLPYWGALSVGAVIIASASGLTAKQERNEITPAITWNLAIAAFAIFAAKWIGQLL